MPALLLVVRDAVARPVDEGKVFVVVESCVAEGTPRPCLTTSVRCRFRAAPVGGMHRGRAVGEGEAARRAYRRDQARSIETARMSASGWTAVLTVTGSPQTRKRLVRMPAQRSSRCSMSVMSASFASPPSAFVQSQADAAEVEAVRVLAQPVEEFLLPFGARVVAHFAAVRVVMPLDADPSLRALRAAASCASPTATSCRAASAPSYSSGKVCSPVTSAVKANSPLPTESGESGSSLRSKGS